MRGDSLRDLYAKTLALIGLGLLGGIGALVDYWPVSGPMPAAASADVPKPAEARAYLAADAMMPDFAARQRAMAPLARAGMRASAVATPAPPVDALVVSASLSDATLSQVALALPPVPPLMDAIAVAPLHNLTVTDVPLARPVVAESLPVDQAYPEGLPSIALSMSDEEAGFLSEATSMVKKTGSTIVSGTMKAGAPIVGMARFLGGAFRKITPFKD